MSNCSTTNDIEVETLTKLVRTKLIFAMCFQPKYTIRDSRQVD